MSETQEPHEPPRHDAPPAVLGPDAVVYDAATGIESPAERWIADRMVAEDRTRDECSDALVNAIARGDVRVTDEGL